MMELFAQTHSICLICQAQRGFLLFLTVNLGRATEVYLGGLPLLEGSVA